MNRRALASLAAVLAVFLLAASSAAAQHLRVYYPDIEQGSSTVVVSPTGQAVLVDGGTGISATNDDLAHFLLDLIDRGEIASLDYVVVTHYDEDHIGSLEDALDYGGVSPTAIVYDRGIEGGVPSTFAYADYSAAAERKTRQTIAPGTDILLGGGVVVETYTVNGDLRDGASVDISGSQQFENSASVAVVVRYGDFDLWIGGDLTGNVDKGVANVEEPAGPLAGDVDVYTFNHHGSETSSIPAFLADLKAEVGINQSSVTNNFGHPRAVVVGNFLATPDTFGNTPIFIQQNPSDPTDTRSDDSLAFAIADPDDATDVVGLPGTLVLVSDGASYQLYGGAVAPIRRVADSGSGPMGDFPPAILAVSRTPRVPTSLETTDVEVRIEDEGAFTAQLLWSLDGAGQTPIAMSHVGGGVYRATLPAVADGSQVAYRVTATDGSAQTASSPSEGFFAGTTPIADLRVNDADGLLLTARYEARVEGNLTAEPGIFHPFVSQIWVEDSTSGLQVFDRELLSLARGDRVSFVGRIEQFSGTTELNIAEAFGNYGATFVSAGSAPAPAVTTLATILSAPESWEGELVRVDGVTIVSGTIPESGNGNLTITDDGGISKLTLRIDGDTDIPGSPTPVGAFDLVGIVGQFDTTWPFDFGYQILPRERADLLSSEINLPPLLVNELHADPKNGAQGDANGDGTRSATDDEFVELLNTTGAALDISGWTLADGIGVRHTFAIGTVVPRDEVVVVFGGGTPTGEFGNAAANGLVLTASTGTLALNNSGDTLTVADAFGAVVQQVTYGGEGGDDTSLNRQPDGTNTPMGKHDETAGSGGALYSPGTRVDGSPFTVPAGAVILTEVLYDAVGADGGFEWIEIHNTTSRSIDLSQLSLGSGGSDWTSTLVQLEGTLAAGGVWVVGGPNSGTENGNPVYDQVVDFSPDIQNASSTAGDGVALFNVRAARVTPTTVPIDAVVYGPNNSTGLIDETGLANAPEVGDAPSGSSVERLDLEGSWQIQSAPNPGSWSAGSPPPPPVEGLLLSEVFYDADGSDDGLEWVELYNSGTETIDLAAFSLGNGGSDYTTSLVQLSGTVAPGATFVVGGPTSGSANGSPSFDQVDNFSPDFQNAGSTADGVALFDVPASQVTASTVPIDAVVYGGSNTNGLIDETGTANPPDVGDAPAGSSVERTTIGGTWQIQSTPTPNASPL